MNDNYFAWSYAAEKFAISREVLSTSFLPNWERMASALGPIHGMVEQHFPDQDIFLRVERLFKVATKFGPLFIAGRVFRGSIENTLRRRRRPTFERMAAEIIAIHDEILKRRASYTEN